MDEFQFQLKDVVEGDSAELGGGGSHQGRPEEGEDSGKVLDNLLEHSQKLLKDFDDSESGAHASAPSATAEGVIKRDCSLPAIPQSSNAFTAGTDSPITEHQKGAAPNILSLGDDQPTQGLAMKNTPAPATPGGVAGRAANTALRSITALLLE